MEVWRASKMGMGGRDEMYRCCISREKARDTLFQPAAALSVSQCSFSVKRAHALQLLTIGLPLQTCKMIDTAPNSTSLHAHLFGIVNLKLRWLPVCGVLRSWSRDGTPLTAVFLQFCVPWWRLQYSSRNIGNWKILWLELEKLINHEN